MLESPDEDEDDDDVVFSSRGGLLSLMFLRVRTRVLFFHSSSSPSSSSCSASRATHFKTLDARGWQTFLVKFRKKLLKINNVKIPPRGGFGMYENLAKILLNSMFLTNNIEGHLFDEKS